MAQKILVIDDEPNVIRIVRTRLEANGYEVADACDGEDGLKKVKLERPDLILVDVMMPKMNGYDFVRNIRADVSTENIPIIMLTAKGKMKDLFNLEGVEDYIVKPYEPEVLLSKIEEHLKRKKQP